MSLRRRVPDALVLIFALIVLAQLASYVLPAGEFERNGRQVVPDTWRAVDAEPLPPLAFLTSIPAGLAAAQEVIFFVFLAGGVIGVVRATGAIDAVIGAALDRLAGRPGWLIGGMVGLFALGASTVGMAEELHAVRAGPGDAVPRARARRRGGCRHRLRRRGGSAMRALRSTRSPC